MNIDIDNACVSNTMQTRRLSHAAMLLAVLLIVTGYASCILRLSGLH
jgi:hypothetical protein